jgi:hypothetical protein
MIWEQDWTMDLKRRGSRTLIEKISSPSAVLASEAFGIWQHET